MRDRRRFHRWECKLSCYCRGEGFEFNAVVSNISFSGAKVYPEQAVPPEGSEIEISLLPEGESLQQQAGILKARVVGIYEDGRCFGVDFYGKWDDRVEILMPIFQKYVKTD